MSSTTNKKWKDKLLEDFLKSGISNESNDRIILSNNPNDVPIRRQRVFEKTVYSITKIGANHKQDSKPTLKKKSTKSDVSPDQYKLLAEIEKTVQHLKEKQRLSSNESNYCIRRECHGNACDLLHKLLDRNPIKVVDSGTQIDSPIYYERSNRNDVEDNTIRLTRIHYTPMNAEKNDCGTLEKVKKKMVNSSTQVCIRCPKHQSCLKRNADSVSISIETNLVSPRLEMTLESQNNSLPDGSHSFNDGHERNRNNRQILSSTPRKRETGKQPPCQKSKWTEHKSRSSRCPYSKETKSTQSRRSKHQSPPTTPRNHHFHQSTYSSRGKQSPRHKSQSNEPNSECPRLANAENTESHQSHCSPRKWDHCRQHNQSPRNKSKTIVSKSRSPLGTAFRSHRSKTPEPNTLQQSEYSKTVETLQEDYPERSDLAKLTHVRRKTADQRSAYSETVKSIKVRHTTAVDSHSPRQIYKTSEKITKIERTDRRRDTTSDKNVHHSKARIRQSDNEIIMSTRKTIKSPTNYVSVASSTSPLKLVKTNVIDDSTYSCPADDENDSYQILPYCHTPRDDDQPQGNQNNEVNLSTTVIEKSMVILEDASSQESRLNATAQSHQELIQVSHKTDSMQEPEMIVETSIKTRSRDSQMGGSFINPDLSHTRNTSAQVYNEPQITTSRIMNTIVKSESRRELEMNSSVSLQNKKNGILRASTSRNESHMNDSTPLRAQEMYYKPNQEEPRSRETPIISHELEITPQYRKNDKTPEYESRLEPEMNISISLQPQGESKRRSSTSHRSEMENASHPSSTLQMKTSISPRWTESSRERRINASLSHSSSRRDPLNKPHSISEVKMRTSISNPSQNKDTYFVKSYTVPQINTSGNRNTYVKSESRHETEMNASVSPQWNGMNGILRTSGSNREASKSPQPHHANSRPLMNSTEMTDTFVESSSRQYRKNDTSRESESRGEPQINISASPRSHHMSNNGEAQRRSSGSHRSEMRNPYAKSEPTRDFQMKDSISPQTYRQSPLKVSISPQWTASSGKPLINVSTAYPSAMRDSFVKSNSRSEEQMNTSYENRETYVKSNTVPQINTSGFRNTYAKSESRTELQMKDQYGSRRDSQGNEYHMNTHARSEPQMNATAMRQTFVESESSPQLQRTSESRRERHMNTSISPPSQGMSNNVESQRRSSKSHQSKTKSSGDTQMNASMSPQMNREFPMKASISPRWTNLSREHQTNASISHPPEMRNTFAKSNSLSEEHPPSENRGTFLKSNTLPQIDTSGTRNTSVKSHSRPGLEMNAVVAPEYGGLIDQMRPSESRREYKRGYYINTSVSRKDPQSYRAKSESQIKAKERDKISAPSSPRYKRTGAYEPRREPQKIDSPRSRGIFNTLRSLRPSQRTSPLSYRTKMKNSVDKSRTSYDLQMKASMSPRTKTEASREPQQSTLMARLLHHLEIDELYTPPVSEGEPPPSNPKETYIKTESNSDPKMHSSLSEPSVEDQLNASISHQSHPTFINDMSFQSELFSTQYEIKNEFYISEPSNEQSGDVFHEAKPRAYRSEKTIATAHYTEGRSSKSDLELKSYPYQSSNSSVLRAKESSLMKLENDKSIISEQSQEDVFLSEMQNDNVQVEGIDSELQIYIQYLQNRLRDCEEMVKRRTKKCDRKHESQTSLDHQSKHEGDLDQKLGDGFHDMEVTKLEPIPYNEGSEYGSLNQESDPIPENPIEEKFSCQCGCSRDEQDHTKIPPFTGCDCMKEGYYKIMRLVYNQPE